MIKGDLIYIISGIAMAAALLVVSMLAEKYVSSKWRMSFAVPIIVGMVLIGIFGFEKCMIFAYIGTAITLAGFFGSASKLRSGSAIVCAVCMVVSIPICMLSGGYRVTDYGADFREGFSVMREHYILTKHKGIDWDALYDEYLLRFNEAENDIEAYMLWQEFTAEFYDGHVSASANDEIVEKAANDIIYGNDYGISLALLSDGSYVAVNVDEDSEAYSAGIRNGTKILTWNDVPVSQFVAESGIDKYVAHSDKDNQAFYAPIFAAGVGGDSVEVAYINENGDESVVSLPKRGGYYDRAVDTIETINRGVEAANMSWTEIDEDTVCLRIKSMMYDIKSANSDDHSVMVAEIRAACDKYKAEGKTNLIIDLRSNGGGSGTMVMAIASVLAPEGEYYYCSDGLWDDRLECFVTDENGDYIGTNDHIFTGENRWGGRIIILVNGYSASAADHLSAIMQGMENVTVAGFTESNGCAQGIGVWYGEVCGISFSSSLVLDRNGDIFIDSGVDRESGNGVDIIIPFDNEAITALFDRDEDYILNWVRDNCL